MKMFIVALLCALSYAQTEWSFASPTTDTCFEQSFTSDCAPYTSTANAASMTEGPCDYNTYNKYCQSGDLTVPDSGIGCGVMTTKYYFTQASCVACQGTCIEYGTGTNTNSGSGGESPPAPTDNTDAPAGGNRGTTAYSIEKEQGCQEGKGGGNPTSTDKTCVNGVLTLNEWRESGSTDCTGTADETATINDLATCKINDDLVSDIKTTIECTDTTVKVTTCGDDVGIICSENDDGYVKGCTKEQCADLCCRRHSNMEAFTHSYWSEWSMRGECFCGTETDARTRKTDNDWLAESGGSVASETCSTWVEANPDPNGDADPNNDDTNSGAMGLSVQGIIAAALLWTFA